MKREFTQLEECSVRDIGFDTLTEESIRIDDKGRVYLDYGNILGDVPFRVRLYIGQGLHKALERAANHCDRPRSRRDGVLTSRRRLNKRGERNEQR